MKERLTPIIYAILAAVFYAINTPLSKLLLASVPSTFMAAFLYLGAGAEPPQNLPTAAAVVHISFRN